jgi:hypothetical protein
VVKSDNKVLILIHPPILSIPTIGIREGPSRKILTTERRSWNMLRLEHQGLMDKTIPFGIKGCKPFYRHRDLMLGS